uniref:Uncharacterized protein n=1 Tax=Panagrellus redivivus TaxID=6233 RepID=A0A7E4ZXP5_PANRE
MKFLQLLFIALLLATVLGRSPPRHVKKNLADPKIGAGRPKGDVKKHPKAENFQDRALIGTLIGTLHD